MKGFSLNNPSFHLILSSATFIITDVFLLRSVLNRNNVASTWQTPIDIVRVCDLHVNIQKLRCEIHVIAVLQDNYRIDKFQIVLFPCKDNIIALYHSH